MDLGLAGKRALITAGSRGLGKASALSLGREGAVVAVASRKLADAEKVEVADEDYEKEIARMAEEMNVPVAKLAQQMRSPDARHALRTRLREAISTAVWAFRVGDEAFEQQGHRRIAEALADC